MVNGLMIRHMEEELMNIWMEPNILVIGKRINSMVME